MVYFPKKELATVAQLLKINHRCQLMLSEEEELTLQEALYHHPHPDARERAAALLKIAEGQSPHAVAKNGLLRPRDPDSVYQWLEYYEREGIAGLFHRRHGGAHRRRL